MQKITKKEAREKYGIITTGISSMYDFFLLKNGDVMDSVGDIRYIAQKKKTRTYRVLFSRDEYGYILIEAKSPKQAKDLFDCGEFDEKDLVYKGGSMIAERVEFIKPVKKQK